MLSSLCKSCGPCASWCIAAPLGRLLLAAIFVLSGVNKITGLEGSIGYASSAGLPMPELAIYAAIVFELVGAALLILGLYARVGAAMLAIFTLITIPYFHNGFADQTQMIMMMKNIAIIGGLLMVIGNGAGNWSLDARCHKACETK